MTSSCSASSHLLTRCAGSSTCRPAALTSACTSATHGLVLTDKAKDVLADKGFDPQLGARPLRRVIQSQIEDAISEDILKGDLTDGQSVLVDVDGEGKDATFTFTGKPLTADQKAEIAKAQEGPKERLDIIEAGPVPGEDGAGVSGDGSDNAAAGDGDGQSKPAPVGQSQDSSSDGPASPDQPSTGDGDAVV